MWSCITFVLIQFGLATFELLFVALLFCTIPILIIYITNRYQLIHYYRVDFTRKSQLEWRQLGLTKEKLKALYRTPPKQNLYKEPTGMILAQTYDKYVCVPIDPNNIYMGMIIGSPGSGKSSGPFISSLSYNYAKPSPVTCYAIDIKGELHKSCVKIGDPHVKIIDPDDIFAAGWDVWYNISQSSPDNSVVDALDKCARAIIVETNEKNAFFSNSARKIFKGAMLYYFRKQVWTDDSGRIRQGFADAVIDLQTTDPVVLVRNILSDEAICKRHPQIISLLGGFRNSDSEALNGIKLSLEEYLDVFALEKVHHMLEEGNNYKASPLDLNIGISIFLSIKENQLDSLKPLIRLISYQILAEMEKRPENCDPILMIYDEFPRIGKIDRITSALATFRSRKVSLWLAIQDFSQLQSVYGHDDARIILNLCEICCVLSCRDVETGKLLEEWSGKYDQPKNSHTQNSVSRIRSGIETVSSERRPVVEIADMMRLRTEKGIALWIEGQYCRAKRIRYYEDPILAPIVAKNGLFINKCGQQIQHMHRYRANI